MKFAIRAAAAAAAAAAVLALTVQGSDATATAGWCVKGPTVNGTCPVGDPPPPSM